jgi:hypothetical protein
MNTVEMPRVDSWDDGIRPAGPSDACFYCRQTVGTPHTRDCVIVQKTIELEVIARLPNDILFRGVWQLEVPYAWEPAQIEFAKNESTWCKSNLLDERETGKVSWNDPTAWDKLLPLDEDGACLCSVLSFRVLRIVDPGPKRAIRKPQPDEGVKP